MRVVMSIFKEVIMYGETRYVSEMHTKSSSISKAGMGLLGCAALSIMYPGIIYLIIKSMFLGSILLAALWGFKLLFVR